MDAVVGAGQVHHADGERVHLAESQAFQVRTVSGREARPRGLAHGQLEVEQVRHGAGIRGAMMVCVSVAATCRDGVREACKSGVSAARPILPYLAAGDGDGYGVGDGDGDEYGDGGTGDLRASKGLMVSRGNSANQAKRPWRINDDFYFIFFPPRTPPVRRSIRTEGAPGRYINRDNYARNIIKTRGHTRGTPRENVPFREVPWPVHPPRRRAETGLIIRHETTFYSRSPSPSPYPPIPPCSARHRRPSVRN